MHHLLEVWFGWVQNWSYVGIILLMAMESSIFPVPSELVIPPAAFLAAEGKLNIYGVVAAGTFGSWLGAAASYWVALWLGRVVIAVILLRYRPNAFWVLIGAGAFRFMLALVLW